MKGCWSELCLEVSKDDFGIITALSTALIAYFAYMLNLNINSPAVDAFLSHTENKLALKNFGNIPAENVSIVFQHFEVGKQKNNMGKIKTSGGTQIFGKDQVEINLTEALNLQEHAQFFVCAWKYKRGLTSVVKERVFTRNPQHPRWATTIKSFVSKEHWKVVEAQLNEIKKSF